MPFMEIKTRDELMELKKGDLVVLVFANHQGVDACIVINNNENDIEVKKLKDDSSCVMFKEFILTAFSFIKEIYVHRED